ncbi:hypothetical protein [Cohnella zeiphila]|uniref:Uncharacterized protein n=1 Tax=Cohnella zeiphila TaxID=2761120 RepID=A0A7X0VYE8_9BACL|nr:hypothetical protein [Cohnella zeiphila]MBB6735294.1 hypothetical protein [Cohnella zeiphila]
MWTKLKRHAALPVLAGAIALLAGVGMNTYAMKDNGTFALKDLSGSRDALDDVAIVGRLEDGYHRTSFRLAQGQISASTDLFRQPQQVDSYRYAAGMDKRIGDWQYQVGGIGPYDITSYKRKDGGSYFEPVGVAGVSPSISDRNPGDNTATYANVVEYGLAKVGDKVFFTVPVSSDYTGTSGIYELSFAEWGTAAWVSREWPDSRKIADISLEANESPEPPNIEVLGLEAVGDKLALLSVEGGGLVVRGYDSGSGELLGEAFVPNFRLPNRAEAGSAAEDSYSEPYEAFSDPDSDVLSLVFRSRTSERPLLLSLDFSNGVRIVHQMNADFSADGKEGFDEFTYLSYRNDKLYVLKSFREPPGDGAALSYDNLLPQHLYVYVFKQSKLLYKGEIVSDLNDDNIEAIHRRTSSAGSYNYDQMNFRRWTNLTVEPLSAEGGNAND